MPAVRLERGARTAAALMGTAIVLGLAGSSARAATEGPRVDGSASGELGQGARLVLRIDAAEVGGWLGLNRLDISLLMGGQAVETITYDVEDQELASKGDGGVSWGTVIATVCVALLGGAFLGNLFASSRRPPPRLSVYSSIQQRIDEERRAQIPTP